MEIKTVECPFCGGTMRLIECDKPLDGYWARYVCESCDAGAGGAYECATREEAVNTAYNNAVMRKPVTVIDRDRLRKQEALPDVITLEYRVNDTIHTIFGKMTEVPNVYEMENDTLLYFDSADCFDGEDWDNYGLTWRVWSGIRKPSLRGKKAWEKWA